MMIDAVMYGMIPRKKTETAVSAPPENRLNRPRTPPAPFDCDCSSWTALKSTYGTGMCDPSRNKKMTKTVNMILFRRSATRNMFWRRESPDITETPSGPHRVDDPVTTGRGSVASGW